MFTESNPNAIRLDDIAGDEALRKQLDLLEEQHQPVVYLEASLRSWEKIKIALLGLRASNVPGMLLLTDAPNASLEEIAEALILLKNFDQLYVHNFLALCGPMVPPWLVKDLQTESKIELKWVKEWLMASHDQRISKYPGLPWRSFIRKVVHENFEFAENFIRFASPESEEQSETNLQTLFVTYLKAKKKTICIFPKNWGKLQ